MRGIMIQLLEDSMGNVRLVPVYPRDRAVVAASNDYDHSCEVWIQEACAADWFDTLPRSAFYGRGRNRQFNDGARFYMDPWTFRHLVGGQSD